MNIWWIVGLVVLCLVLAFAYLAPMVKNAPTPPRSDDTPKVNTVIDELETIRRQLEGRR
jgi:hypothetical protein